MLGFEFVVYLVVLCLDVHRVLQGFRCVVLCCVILVPYDVLFCYLGTEFKNQFLKSPVLLYVAACVLCYVLNYIVVRRVLHTVHRCL